MRTCAAVFVLVLLALPGAAAEEEPALGPEDLALLPMEHARFGLFAFENRARINQLEYRHDRLRALEAERLDKPTAWRQAERDVAAKALAETSAMLEAALRERGIDEATLLRIARFPPGPMRAERYAFAVVRDLPMEAREAALVREVAAATLGALLAFEVQRRAMEPDDEDTAEGTPHVEALEAQGERIRRRFWQLLDYLLTEEQKRSLRSRLPHPLRDSEDVFDHATHLAGLTIGQVARIRALEAELESEAGPDHALAERLERELDDAALTDAERGALWERLDAIWYRVVGREQAVRERLEGVLTPAQRSALAAILPRVSVDQRLADPEVVLAGVTLTRAQQARLVPLARELITLRETLEGQMEGLRAELDEMGPDSPQMAGMAMREASVAGTLIRRTHAAMRTLFLDVLTRDQVIQWVVAGPVEAD